MSRLVVAIHDVAPSTVAAAQELRGRVGERVDGPVSLLVVPRRGGLESWRAGPHAEWLRARRDAGDEIVVHGYAHADRSGRDGPELRGRRPDGIDAVVRTGLDELHCAGIAAEGFIAPAYVHPYAAHAACRRAGLRWWATRGWLRWSDGRRPLPSVGLGASTRIRRALSPVMAAAAGRALTPAPALRLDLHPSDLDHPRLDRAARDLLDLLLAQGRTPVAHAELVRAIPPGPAPSSTRSRTRASSGAADY